MSNPVVEFVTPTYNRGHLLGRLYDSLIAYGQLFPEVQMRWIVVNDGSRDNTADIVREMSSRKELTIQYIEQSNAGKFDALNNGLRYSHGKWVMIIDSDDILCPHGAERLRRTLTRVHHKSKKVYGGFGNCIDPNGKIVGSDVRPRYVIASFGQAYTKMGIRGDKLGFVLGAALKACPHLIFKGEKRIAPSHQRDVMAIRGRFLFCSETVAVREYLADGITTNISGIEKRCPRGTVAAYITKASSGDYSWKYRLYAAYKSSIPLIAEGPWHFMHRVVKQGHALAEMVEYNAERH